MKLKNISAVAIALALAIPYLTLPPAAVAQKRLDIEAQKIEDRDRKENGITVHEPRVFDDAQLQQRLQELEARLATLQVIDQKAITDRFGTIAGASARTSSFAVNVQGPSVPGVDTTTKLPTEQVTTDSTGVKTVTNSGVEDVVTKVPQFNPPTATAPASNVSMPTSFSVSSSDVLDEMMQLQAEINGLRLLLSGDLSSHYIRGGESVGNEITKFKTTLGFNISVKPDGVEPEERYKDAVAVVEVEVENVCETISNEPPMITALLPREKTYNVAEITDKSSSIGAGVATQIVGFSGSFVRGHKTHYLVRDQDTIALTFTPSKQPINVCGVPKCGEACQQECKALTDDAKRTECVEACQKKTCTREKKRVGFMWQFRPVLGRRYVRIAEKTTFVQLAFPVPADAGDDGRAGEIGRVTVRTYWREYDRKLRVHKEVIPGSVSEQVIRYDIPRYKLAVNPAVFNFQNSLEDLGGGQILVKLPGRFLPGTNVRIGSTILSEGDRFKHRYSSIRFVAPASDLATKKVYLVAHDGTEVPLLFANTGCTTLGVAPPTITPIDEANSRLTARVSLAGMNLPKAPPLVFALGMRVFGYSDAPVRREEVFEENDKGDKVVKEVLLSALVPNSVLSTNSELKVQTIFAQNSDDQSCFKAVSLRDADPKNLNNQTVRLVLLEQEGGAVKFLAFGNGLNSLSVLSPQPVAAWNALDAATADTARVLTLSMGQVTGNKFVVFRRGDGLPLVVPMPELTPRQSIPPSARETLAVNDDEAVIIGDGLSDVTSVSYKDKDVRIALEDNGKRLRLTGLRALEATQSTGKKIFVLKFKSPDTKPKEVEFMVFNGRAEVTTPKD